jgi:ATP-binding cassette, subfamily B, bacterial
LSLNNPLTAVSTSIVDSPRWLLLKSMLATSRPRTALVFFLVILLALLPTGFAFAAGALVGALPETVSHGLDSPAGSRLSTALTVVGVLFVAQQILASAMNGFGDALARRVVGHHVQRLMRATTSPATLAHLERPTYLDQIALADPSSKPEAT